jgi:hypothetical protein
MLAPMPFRIQLTQSIAYAERSRHRLDVCRPRDAVAIPSGWRRGSSPPAIPRRY